MGRVSRDAPPRRDLPGARHHSGPARAGESASARRARRICGAGPLGLTLRHALAPRPARASPWLRPVQAPGLPSRTVARSPDRGGAPAPGRARARGLLAHRRRQAGGRQPGRALSAFPRPRGPAGRGRRRGLRALRPAAGGGAVLGARPGWVHRHGQGLPGLRPRGAGFLRGDVLAAGAAVRRGCGRAGRPAYEILLRGVAGALAQHGGAGVDAEAFARQVWALSHGVASLERAGCFGRTRPGEAQDLLVSGVEALLRGARDRAAAEKAPA